MIYCNLLRRNKNVMFHTFIYYSKFDTFPSLRHAEKWKYGCFHIKIEIWLLLCVIHITDLHIHCHIEWVWVEMRTERNIK